MAQIGDGSSFKLLENRDKDGEKGYELLEPFVFLPMLCGGKRGLSFYKSLSLLSAILAIAISVCGMVLSIQAPFSSVSYAFLCFFAALFSTSALLLYALSIEKAILMLPFCAFMVFAAFMMLIVAVTAYITAFVYIFKDGFQETVVFFIACGVAFFGFLISAELLLVSFVVFRYKMLLEDKENDEDEGISFVTTMP